MAGGRGPARGPPPPAAVEVNNEDCVAELTRSHMGALMKADAKRALLQNVLVNKNELLRLARDEGTTDLQDQLEETYFSKRRRRGDDGPDRTVKGRVDPLLKRWSRLRSIPIHPPLLASICAS